MCQDALALGVEHSVRSRAEPGCVSHNLSTPTPKTRTVSCSSNAGPTWPRSRRISVCPASGEFVGKLRQWSVGCPVDDALRGQRDPAMKATIYLQRDLRHRAQHARHPEGCRRRGRDRRISQDIRRPAISSPRSTSRAGMTARDGSAHDRGGGRGAGRSADDSTLILDAMAANPRADPAADRRDRQGRRARTAAGARSRHIVNATEPGRNCWRIERADRASVVIDADDYFAAVRQAMLTARKQISC